MARKKEAFYSRIYHFRLPFAYSLLNEEISQFHNGPIFGNGGGCCAGTCVKRTGLEVSWELQENKHKGSILVLNVNPSNKSPLD